MRAHTSAASCACMRKGLRAHPSIHTACWVLHPPPQPPVFRTGGDSDAEMADASQGGSEDCDGEDDEMLREWSKRLVK